MKPAKTSRIQSTTVLVMAIVILVPSMIGFVMKFIEFIHTFQGDVAGIFAITPISNYLLASLGFFCLLIWATMNGMFHDIEKPKQTMLDTENMLDADTWHPTQTFLGGLYAANQASSSQPSQGETSA